MPVVVSKEGNSPSQLRALREVRSGHLASHEVARRFYRIANDSDILAGDENLHPAWMDLYRRHQRILLRELPAELHEGMHEFFTFDPIDVGIRVIDPTGLKIAFLLGAGASNPAPSDIPVTSELLSHLFTRAQRSNSEEVLRVAEFCNENRINNIEDLLTAAQLATFCSRSPAILKLMDYLLYRNLGDEPEHRRQREPQVSSVALLQGTFQVLFGSLSGMMLPAKPNSCHTAVAEFAKAHSDCAIITTNYDCCIDLALGNPGEAFSYRLGFANHPELKSSRDGKTQLIKLHGSLNWFYCETCQEVQLIDIARAVQDYEADESPFPVIGICRKCNGQRRGMAVPPLAMKFDFFPPLTPLLGYAQEAFQDAELIVAIGYSFAEADLYISRMISKSMQAKPMQKLMIVDRSYEVAQKVGLRLERTVPEFDKSRVLSACGDCAEILPKFLAGQLRETIRQELADGVEVKQGSQPALARP